MPISKLLEEISVLLRRVSSVGLPQGGKLPVDSSGRLGKWPLRDCEILRSSRCGEYYKSFYLNYLLSLARGPVAVSSWAGAGLSIEQATVVGVVGLGFGFVGTVALACSSTIFRLLFLVLYLRGRAYDGTSQERSSLQVGAQYFCVHFHCISIMPVRFLFVVYLRVFFHCSSITPPLILFVLWYRHSECRSGNNMPVRFLCVSSCVHFHCSSIMPPLFLFILWYRH